MIAYRFPSKQAFRTLAAAEGLITSEGDLILASHTHAICEVGTIYEGGSWDRDCNQITAPTQLPGWHVNTAGLSPEAWDQYLIVVNTAFNTWAGDVPQAPDAATLEAMAA